MINEYHDTEFICVEDQWLTDGCTTTGDGELTFNGTYTGSDSDFGCVCPTTRGGQVLDFAGIDDDPSLVTQYMGILASMILIVQIFAYLGLYFCSKPKSD